MLAGLTYVLARRGPLALSLNQGGGFIRTRPDLPRPNMQLYFCPLTYERAPPGRAAADASRSVLRIFHHARRLAGREPG